MLFDRVVVKTLAQSVKNLPAVQETRVWFLGWEDPLEKKKGNPLQYPCLENLMDRWSLVGPSPLCCKESGMTEQLTLAYTVETDLPYLKDSAIDNVDFLSLDGWLGNWTLYHLQFSSWAYCTPRGPTHWQVSWGAHKSVDKRENTSISCKGKTSLPPLLYFEMTLLCYKKILGGVLFFTSYK